MRRAPDEPLEAALRTMSDMFSCLTLSARIPLLLVAPLLHLVLRLQAVTAFARALGEAKVYADDRKPGICEMLEAAVRETFEDLQVGGVGGWLRSHASAGQVLGQAWGAHDADASWVLSGW